MVCPSLLSYYKEATHAIKVCTSYLQVKMNRAFLTSSKILVHGASENGPTYQSPSVWAPNKHHKSCFIVFLCHRQF